MTTIGPSELKRLCMLKPEQILIDKAGDAAISDTCESRELTGRGRRSTAVDRSWLMGHRGIMENPLGLERFVVAQDRPGTEDNFEAATRELRAGRKTSCWMWFVFPVLQGVIPDPSPTSEEYAISDWDEAAAYLRHDLLGPRLHRGAQLAVRSGAVNANTLMGYPDDRKLKSSMTLFAEVARGDGEDADFVAVLRKYYRGERDRKTIRELQKSKPTTTATPETDVRAVRGEWRPWRRR
jgi:uncharacterized protein (DUF1810 family)